MAELAQGSGKGGKKGKPKKLSTRVDFTPMVDLGFLLITFFMLATNMSKPQTMEIVMPAKDVTEEDKTKVKASRAVTIVLDKNDVVYYYEGTRENNIDPVLNKTDFSPSGIRKFLIKRNYEIMVKVNDLKAKKDAKQITQEEFDKQKNEIVAAKTAPIVVIKATDVATYGNLVNILDEMAICNIERYTIDKIADFDMELIKKKPNS
jgi:biopolymer transport protein ExbD